MNSLDYPQHLCIRTEGRIYSWNLKKAVNRLALFDIICEALLQPCVQKISIYSDIVLVSLSFRHFLSH